MSKLSATQRRRRAYAKAGFYGLQKSMPQVLERARDESVPAEKLSDLERGARELRLELLQDSGGVEEASAARRLLCDLIVGSALTIGTVDKFLFEEVGGSLVNRRDQKIRRVVLDRERIAGGLARLLAQLGLEKQQKTVSLAEYLESRSAAQKGADTATEDAPEPGEDRDAEDPPAGAEERSEAPAPDGDASPPDPEVPR